MNNRIRRALQPNLAMFFASYLIFVALSVFYRLYTLAGVQLFIVVLLYVLYRRAASHRRKVIAEFIDSASINIAGASKHSMLYFPMPMMILRPETGDILWCNERFSGISGTKDQAFNLNVHDLLKDFDTRWLIEGKTEYLKPVELNSKIYLVFGSVARASSGDYSGGLLATTYWLDVTGYEQTKSEYLASRPVVSICMIDNYDEVMKNVTDTTKSTILAEIDRRVTDWAKGKNCLLRKFDRDRYIFVFERRYLDGILEEKFSILDNIRENVVQNGIPVTMSIGLGVDGSGFGECYNFASLGIDMALSRGGDQAVIRNRINFEFHGGRSKEIERRTKVKARVVANALGELIGDSTNILVMGHKAADFDSIGAAAGIMCIARAKGKKTRIVIDREASPAQMLIDRLTALPEYDGAFITPEEAIVMAGSGTLLVVVDTSRSSYVESPQLLESCNRVVVIDHHRRVSDYIDKGALNLHEPYASSASELVTELISYLVDDFSMLLRAEAESLMLGILLDTWNFTIHTGVRTFEAAATLRRAGADTAETKKYLQVDYKSYVDRSDIVKSAELYRGTMAISEVEGDIGRALAGQAANELLDVMGITAAFVVFRRGDSVMISARSLGKTNVQIVMEELGGGGHMTTAGAQIEGKDVLEVVQMLKAAIDKKL